MPTISQVNIDPVLSNLSVEYKSQGLIGAQVLPHIPVKTETGTYYIFDKDNLRVYDTQRAAGTKYKRTSYSVSTSTFNCEEQALEETLDDRERNTAADSLELEKSTMERVADRVLLAKEKRIADLVQSTSNITNYTTLSSNMQWSDGTNSRPFADIATAITTIRSNTGLIANTMVMSFETWLALREHDDVVERFKYVSGPQEIQPSMVAPLFGLNQILVAGASYNQAFEGATDSLAGVWNDNVLIAYINSSPAIRSVSLGYSFQKEPMMTRVYRDETINSDVYRVGEVVDEKLVAEAAGYLIVNTCA